MKRSRKKNPSSSITLLMKSLTQASEILLMIRKLLVIDVCKHSFHKKSLLKLESAEMPLNAIATVSYRSGIYVPKAQVALLCGSMRNSVWSSMST